MEQCKRFFFPETAAGGYTRIDGTIEFYTRISALLRPDMRVLDFGAGRGAGVQDDPVPYRRALRTLKGKCVRVIGVDVDAAVLENPGLDEAYVAEPGGVLPLKSESVDLIVSDNTFEHITEPTLVSRELTRVLKPGGWICARTPNRWGYIALGAALVPNRWHIAILRRLQPDRKDIDVFPTAYKLNTKATILRYFPSAVYEHYNYTHVAEPAYFASSRAAWRVMLLAFRILPSAAGTTLMLFLQKRSVAEPAGLRPPPVTDTARTQSNTDARSASSDTGSCVPTRERILG